MMTERRGRSHPGLLLVLLALAPVLTGACDPSVPTSADEPSTLQPSEQGSGTTSTAPPVLRESCQDVDQFRVNAEVSGNLVEVKAKIDGQYLRSHGTVGRFVFWPNGRHIEPRLVSELFQTGNDDDFPLEARLSYKQPAVSEPTRFHGNLDFEMLLNCFDPWVGRFVLGWFNEYGDCVPFEQIIVQCDRGVDYTIE